MSTSFARPGAAAARLLALATALSGAGCATHMRFVCPAHGGPEWSELTSEHVVLRTDLGASDAESMIRELELTRALLAQALDLAPTGTPDRIEVVALATHEELTDFTGTPRYVGHAMHDDDGRQRLLVAGLLSQDEQEVMIAHEMAHLVSLHAIPRQPRWFAEGLATYLSSVARTAADGTRAVGSTPQLWIAGGLRYHRQATVRELMAWGGTRESSLYATAWLLVRHLATERPEALVAFERRLSGAEPAVDAWNATFPEWSLARRGGPESLDLILQARARDISGVGRRVSATIDPRIQVRMLSPAEVHGIRLDLPRKWKPEALQAELREALAEDSGHVEALAAMAEKEHADQGLVLARRAVEAHPEDAAAWRLLARWLPASGGEEREAALRKAVELAPDRPDHVLALAGEIDSRDPKEAERISRRAIEVAPWSSRALLLHAGSLAWLGRCDEASVDLQRAQDLQADAKTFDARRSIASFRARLERRCTVPAAARADPLVDEGFSAMREQRPGREVEVYPANGWAWTELALVLEQGGHQEAEAAFRRQLEVDPDHPTARRSLASLLLESGRPRDALSVLEPLESRQPSADVLMDVGRAHLALGEDRAGVAALEKALKLSPGPASLNNAAHWLAVAGARLPQASAWAEAAVKGHVEEIRKLAGRGPSAREASSATSLLNAWATLGWVRLQQGRIEDAERYVSAAVRLQRSGEGFEHMGEILERRDRRADAVVAYARAVAAEGNLEARRRLEILVPPGELDSLVAAARTDLLRQRILLRKPAAGSAGTDARILLVLAVDGNVAEVLPADGKDVPGVGALRGARHGAELLEPSPGRLVLAGRYRCAAGECAWFLGDASVPEGPLPE